MSAVPGYSHLHRRGAVYQFRRRVPPDLVQAFGFPDWRESLKTKDLEEAKRRARQRGIEVDREIDAMRARLKSVASRGLTKEDARRIALRELADWLATDEEDRLSRGMEAVENAEAVLGAREDDWRQALASGDWRSAEAAAVLAAEQAGLWYPPGDPSLQMLAAEILRAQVRYADMVSDRQRGLVVETPLAPELPKASSRSASEEPTVSDLIARYRAKRTAERGELSTDRKYKHVFRALEEALGGDRLVSAITHADCEDLQALLRSVPQHAGKRYPGMSLKDAAEAGRREGVPPLAPNTVASYMQSLISVLNYAKKHRWLTENPATGMGKKGIVSVQRRGFKAPELKTLFASLVRYRDTKPSRYWIPALGAFTGARLNELCQLRVADIGCEDGVDYLDFTLFDAEGVRLTDKRLKTEASERKVPVPPALIDAGFLAFVEQARAEGRERLFPELERGPDGAYSHGFSKWFGRALGAVGLDAKSLVFHSFRHGFRDACRVAEIDTETASALGGWALQGEASGYGRATQLPVLYRAASRVRFAGFVLPTGDATADVQNVKTASPPEGEGL